MDTRNSFISVTYLRKRAVNFAIYGNIHPCLKQGLSLMLHNIAVDNDNHKARNYAYAQ